MSNPTRSRKTKGVQPRLLHAVVSRRRENQAVEALVALALRNTQSIVTDEEVAEYMSKPVTLSKEDEAALKRARPKLLAALRKELRPDGKRLAAKWANERLANQYRLLSDASKKIRSLDDKLHNALADLSLQRELYRLAEKERDGLYQQIQNLRRDA